MTAQEVREMVEGVVRRVLDLEEREVALLVNELVPDVMCELEAQS